MRKSLIVLLLIIQIILIFLFTNVHSLLSEVEKTEQHKIDLNKGMSEKSFNVIKVVNDIFSYLVIILGIFILFTGGFLVYALSSKKNKIKAPDIPQLQNYLFQLKDSEVQLKNLVEKQQKKVLSSDELSRNIINSMDVALILINDGKKIEIFNKRAEQIFNIAFALAKNNNFSFVLGKYKNIVDTVYNNIEQNIEFSEISSNNKFFKVELIKIADIGTLIIIDDITENKKREAIIQKNRNFIMLGEMTTFLVHEVRNSLGVIFGYTRTIDKEVSKIEKVNKEIIFLTDMMERFLNFSKPLKEEKKIDININEIIVNLSDKYNVDIVQSGIKASIKADVIKLESIFSNIIKNAIDAFATKIEINIERKKSLSLIIKDNGRGIDKSIIDNIWLPFFTTKSKGTGMGLALVKKFLHHLNGDIIILKSNDKGTIFKIELY
jgi:signal transduction histidine kinase